MPEDTVTDSSDEPGVVLFLSGDLMFASRVRAAAAVSELTFRLAGDLPGDPDEQVKFVVLDLATRSKLIPEFVKRTEAACPNAKTIAYGPHVQLQHLNAARGAGIETVLTRGQFDAKLGSLFASSQ